MDLVSAINIEVLYALNTLPSYNGVPIDTYKIVTSKPKDLRLLLLLQLII